MVDVGKGFKKLPKVQYITQSGHNDSYPEKYRDAIQPSRIMVRNIWLFRRNLPSLDNFLIRIWRILLHPFDTKRCFDIDIIKYLTNLVYLCLFSKF